MTKPIPAILRQRSPQGTCRLNRKIKNLDFIEHRIKVECNRQMARKCPIVKTSTHWRVMRLIYYLVRVIRTLKIASIRILWSTRLSMMTSRKINPLKLKIGRIKMHGLTVFKVGILVINLPGSNRLLRGNWGRKKRIKHAKLCANNVKNGKIIHL